jgi:hypothetical protein
MGLEGSGREAIQPALELPVLVGEDQPLPRPVDQGSHTLEILCCQRVLDRLGVKALPLVPDCGTRVQRGNCVWGLRLAEARLEQFGEEVMVAKPALFVVERNDKEVAATEGCQHGLTVRFLCHRFAKPCAQALQDRSV